MSRYSREHPDEPINHDEQAKPHSVQRLVNRLLDDIPTNWCDSLLTGPTAALKGNGGTWGCPDIERLLLALKERMRKTANDEVSNPQEKK